MKGALSLGNYLGIPLKIHWTFGFFFLFIAFISVKDQLNIEQSIGAFLYLFILFLFVVLHEFGHALAARKYGIETKDIILTPIGGVARMEKLPKKPIREFVVAFAGPLVNLFLGTLSGLLLWLIGGNLNPIENVYLFYQSTHAFLKLIIIVNAVLFFFNLIPAFPMDGGRILRSLLAIKLGRLTSTKIASFIGQILAIGFIILGLTNQQFVLVFIGGFIFLSAGNERKQLIKQNRLETTKAKDIMLSNFQKIYTHQSFADVFSIKSYAQEKSFLVFSIQDILVGSLPSQFIDEARINGLETNTVQSLMQNRYFVVDENDTLEYIFQLLQSKALAVVGVKNDNELVGIIDRSMLRNFINNNV